MQELEKILEEIKDELKDIYLDIANNYNISDLQYDGDKVTCLASKFRCDAGKRIENIIRKHMNDSWIPVEKDLPKNESEVWVVLESTYGTEYRTYSSARYLYFENYGESHWCDNHYGYLEWDKYSDGNGGSSQYKVIAWQSIAPYRPERSEGE